MCVAGTLYQVLCDESGVSVIEYGLIASLIAVAGIAALRLIGTNLSSTFTTIANNL